MRWNPSPPGQKYSMGDRGQTGPSRIDSQRSDLYSGKIKTPKSLLTFKYKTLVIEITRRKKVKSNEKI